jgi:pSer/pThr/pTyr-binding forkhead associated (FHA) protein
VVIADSAVSAEHARVFRVGRAWVVSDLGSTNGTQVNQTRVQGEMPLAPDDVLELGSVRLKVIAR